MSQPSNHKSSRRKFLRVGAGIAAVALAGCVGGQSGDTATTGTTDTRTTEETTTEGTGTTGETTEETPSDESNVAWKLELDGEARLGPAIIDDALYVGDSFGVLRALDPQSGDERWRFKTAGSFFSGTGADHSPILADGTLYAVSGSQSGAHGEEFAVYALDAETGEEKWSVAQESPKFLSLFGVADGRAFVGTSDDALGSSGETLRALDAATGEEQWTGEIGDSRGVAVTEEGVFVASSSRLDAFDVEDGSRRFGKKLPGRVLGPEVGRVAGDSSGDNVVYAGFRAGEDSGALALDPQSGEERWRVEGWFVTSIFAGGGTNGSGEGTGDEDGNGDGSLLLGGEHVAKLAPDGTERWRYDAGGLLSEGALVGDSLFVGGNPITALSTSDGSAQWSNPVDAEFGVVEGADEEVVAVQRGNTTGLDAFDAESGDVRFTFDVGGKWLSPVAVRSGTVYAGSDAGVLYALRG